ncbi:MAG: glutamine--fructose-6-phosphate transaminase (isomerizing) [Proteobacteria bacterium]|nr:glutamine--fructose-6-phosphate transaminase (isomerizing) [Pseudomonadota bacterium]MBI3499964.1 glutamine--fructose-6-phosphate transaminase (isomerizing) [Pseudomonadota bacterium]
MCGIIGILGKRPVAALLIDSLKRLEYRGYDSAGIATVVDGHIERRRAPGKLANLERRLEAEPLAGLSGIGHTRWATHGPPNEANAHPHATRRVAIVHNGIIENYRAIKDELEAGGRRFQSDTDTEVVAQLLDHYLAAGKTPEEAMAAAMKRLEGAFAFAIILADRPDLMLAARRGSALAVGYGEGEMYVGSDAIALAPLTRRIAYLEEGDWAIISPGGADIRDAGGAKVKRPIKQAEVSGDLIGKGNHRHFMAKEIFEQPEVIGYTLGYFHNPVRNRITLPPMPFDLATVPRITAVAAGTSYYAALTAKYWLERIARLPVEVDTSSEFRYRAPDMPEGGAALMISQSGESLDTLMALRYAKSQRQHIVSLVNVPESTMAREADAVLRTYAGPEIGVASTKAFTTQLTVLACLTLAIARARGKLDGEEMDRLGRQLMHLPSLVSQVLERAREIERIAEEVAEARDVLYLGRGINYPIALEGALKLKEISYIHAEGYAAGEMKHGPIALISEDVPVIVIAPSDDLFAKTASNIQEVLARGGKVIVLTDAEGAKALEPKRMRIVKLPKVEPLVAPILYAVPVQLLAYYAAVAKGTDVDQPRNLAKSVTVE